MDLYVRALWGYASARLALIPRGEQGSVVEKVILTAVFAVLAIAVGAIIVAKVMDKANSINLKSIPSHRSWLDEKNAPGDACSVRKVRLWKRQSPYLLRCS